MDKIKNYIKNNFKPLFFIMVFAIAAFCFNINEQNLNYLLKRGTILEYSIKDTQNPSRDEIKSFLASIGVNYSFIDIVEYSDINYFDKDDQKVEKALYIALPTLARENKKEFFNRISDFVFENYKNSSLINLRTLNDNYHKPYSTFIRFLYVLFASAFVWFLILLAILREKFILECKDAIYNYTQTKKENFKKLIEKTKEKGFSYFLKKILFDEKEEDVDFTKEIISTVVFVIVAVIIIRFFIGELRWIPSGSMRPTILERDRVFVQKLYHPQQDIKRGDILVFYPPQTVLSKSPLAVFKRLTGIFCDDIAYIKRTVALPGEKFEVKFDENNKQHRVYINDKALLEPYINNKYDWSKCTRNMYCGPLTVPEHHYLMLGDNRGNSQDGRFWGFLDEKRIIGRANFMFWPIKRINTLVDRYLLLHEKKTEEGYIDYNFILNRYEFLYKI